MKTVILAGGRGTRLDHETVRLPKPMVTVGGEPLLWHLMKHFSCQGFDEFVVALGYQADRIREYLQLLALGSGTFTAGITNGRIDRLDAPVADWRVTGVDTGMETQTGGRIKRAARYIDDDTFMISYADTLADIDLGRLLDFHVSHGRLATVTAVRAPAQFGYLDVDGSRVRRFSEKVQPDEVWINGGFFVVDRRVLDYIDDDLCVWEREPLARLAEEGELMAYRHDGFWHSMETLRDRANLEEMWDSGKAPWRRW